MGGSKFVSRGTAWFAVVSTLNLLIIMAAIANDGSVGNSTTMLTTSAPKTVIQTSSFTSTFKPLPSISSLVRGTGYDTVIKVPAGGGGKDRIIPPTPVVVGVGSGGKPALIGNDNNSTMSSMIDFINSSSSNSPFTTQNWTEVRAQYKSNALLPCHVRNSGDGVTVSWIRRKDYHLLTVGLQTYSSDDRFQAIHSQSPDDWTLKIKYVQPRDGGLYECQTSTHPPSSIFINLSVVEVRAEIVGGPEKIYKAGSTVELKCDLFDSTEEPEYVFWYQGLQMINYDRSRHINVTHYKSSSVLILQNVQKSATGNYTCAPANSHPASIFVHIINGENPAAMQHGSHSTSCVPCPPLWFLSFLLSLTLQALYFRFMSNHVDRYHERGTTSTIRITPTSPLSPTPLDSPQNSSSCRRQPQTHHNRQLLLHPHHHQQPFHHNQGCFCHHLQSHQNGDGESFQGTATTSPCHRFAGNDDHNRPPAQADKESSCGESQREKHALPMQLNTTRNPGRGRQRIILHCVLDQNGDTEAHLRPRPVHRLMVR